jgi:hypothetical protein
VPVLVISSDPFLVASLEAVGRGRVRVARLDPSRRPAGWPAEPTATVVLDVTARQRDALHAWVRRHHGGPLVVLLKPGERRPALPPDPARVVVGRPFRLADVVGILERPPAQAGDDSAGHAGAPSGPEPAGPGPDPGPGGPGPGPVAVGAAPAGPGRGARDLLQASAEQRRRRLGALAAATPAQAAPPAARRLPRPDWPTAATRLGGRRRRPAGRGRAVAGRVLVAVLVLLVLAGAWLGFGLLEARQDLQVGAAAVRAELARAEAALADGRPADAAAAVRAARGGLQATAAVADRRELRVAARLPVLAGGVADTRRLLAAAAGLTEAAGRAVAVAAHLRSGRAALLRDGRFDLDALDDAAGQARALVAELDRARSELAGVRGGPFAPGVAETRRWALDQVEAASDRARPLAATLAALPDAVGAGEPRGYLVVLTSLAERRPDRGAPLAAREVVVDGGVVRARPGGAALAGDLGDTGASPHRPGTGRALLRAAEDLGRPRPDAVVVLDPLAVRALLEATGPLPLPGAGRLAPEDAVRRLAGAGLPDQAGRRRDQAVLEAVLARFLDGHDLVATGRVVGAAGAAGHLQVHAADPGLRRLLGRHRLDGRADRG